MYLLSACVSAVKLLVMGI